MVRPGARRQPLAMLQAIDNIIRRLNRLISTVEGQEKALATASYLASITQHLSTKIPLATFHMRRFLWMRKKSRSFALPKLKSPATEWEALSSLCSEARLHLHLFGVLSLWASGSELLESPNGDGMTQGLAALRILTGLASQVFENVAFLATKGVLSKRLVSMDDGVARLYRWGNRSWLGYIFLEYLVLWREANVRSTTDTARTSKAVHKEELRTEVRHWRRRMFANILWTPLYTHLCLEEGIGIPDSLTGYIGLMADGWDVYDAWVATAKGE